MGTRSELLNAFNVHGEKHGGQSARDTLFATTGAMAPRGVADKDIDAAIAALKGVKNAAPGAFGRRTMKLTNINDLDHAAIWDRYNSAGNNKGG
jgi:hypothetical protein